MLKFMLTTLAVVALLIPPTVANVSNCSPSSTPCTTGNCSNQNIAVNATTLGSGDVQISLSVTGGGTAGVAIGTVAPTSTTQLFTSNGGCNVRAGLKNTPGLNWGSVSSCSEVTFRCT